MVARLLGIGLALPPLVALAMWSHCGYECYAGSEGVVVRLHGDFDAGPVTIVAHDGREAITCELDTSVCGASWDARCGDAEGLRILCARFDDPVVAGLHVSVVSPEVPSIVDVRITRGASVLADRHVAMHYDFCGAAYEDIDF